MQKIFGVKIIPITSFIERVFTRPKYLEEFLICNMEQVIASLEAKTDVLVVRILQAVKK